MRRVVCEWLLYRAAQAGAHMGNSGSQIKNWAGGPILSQKAVLFLPFIIALPYEGLRHSHA